MTHITAKTIRRMLLTGPALAAVVLLGGLRGAQAGVDVWTTSGPEGGTIQALANAVVHALIWMQTATPEQILGALPPQFAAGQRKIVLAAIRKTMPTYSRDGQISRSGAENVLRVQAEIDPMVRDAKIDLAETYENSFARVAAAKYGW